MEKSRVKEIIIDSFNELIETEGISIDVNADTALMGSDSVIDSLGLVTLLVDIEARLSDEDVEISILSEKAMSQKNSPFLNIESLTEFISEQL
jgi:acyl carrier protein